MERNRCLLKRPVRYLVQAAIIAAVYVAVTLAIAPLSFSEIQIRISEAMMILPLFTPAAIPGLAIGCFFANLIGSPLGWPDWVFGTLATLVSALLVRFLRRWKWISPLYPTVINAFVIGWELNLVLALPYWPSVGFVAIGEALACFGLGLPLMILMERLKVNLFPDEPKRPVIRPDDDKQG
jgi:uncharacterized membrane protein